MGKRKKWLSFGLLGLTFLVILFGLLLAKKNNQLVSNKIQIIDATYNCSEALEPFYEDSNYIYSFPCIMSSSVYVKFSNGNKVLVVKALDEKLVTINELLDAGLKVYKSKK